MSDSDLTLMEIFFKEEESLRVKLGLAESSETFSALKNKLKEGKWTPFRDFIGLAAKNAKELMDVRVETILVSAWAKYFSLRKYLDKEKFDIQVEYIGLRPGEKLHEELITEGEGILPTSHEKILVLKGIDCNMEILNGEIESLDKLAVLRDAVAIKDRLHATIPGYQPQ